MRFLALVVVAVLAAAAFVVPQASRPVPRAPEASAPAPYTVCPLGEAARRTTALTVVGGEAGDITANVFSGSEIQASGEITMSDTGTGVLEVGELTGLARAPLLLSLDDPNRAVETVLSGAGVGGAACSPGSADAQVVLGGATAEGNTYTLVLANPFAGAATVDILAASEVGTESDPALQGVVVPPRSLVPVELSDFLPGRQRMSAAVVTSQGRVVAGALHTAGNDFSASSGQEAGLDWYVPVPGIEDTQRSIVLFAPGRSEVPFQLDVYSADGVVEAAYEDLVPAQGQAVIPAGELLEGAGMVRVVAGAPVAGGLALSGGTGRAVLPGVATPAPIWMLPGAGRVGDSVVHVFNPGEVDVTASLQAGTGNDIETIEVPASSTVEVALPERSVGARLEADGNVVVHWSTVAEEGLAGDAAQAPGG